MMPCLRDTPEGTVIAVRVQPRASRNEISGLVGDELKIKVTAPPVDSAANEALREFLAERLGCPRSAVDLLRGHTSRHKTMLVRGVPAQRVQQLLGEA